MRYLIIIAALFTIACGDTVVEETPGDICVVCIMHREWCAVEDGRLQECVIPATAICFRWADGVCLDSGMECQRSCDGEGSAITH